MKNTNSKSITSKKRFQKGHDRSFAQIKVILEVESGACDLVLGGPAFRLWHVTSLAHPRERNQVLAPYPPTLAWGHDCRYIRKKYKEMINCW